MQNDFQYRSFCRRAIDFHNVHRSRASYERGAMRFTKPGESTPLYVILDTEATGLFPRATILNRLGNVVSTVDLTASPGATGHYKGNLILTTEGDYSIKFLVYDDIARTIQNSLYRPGDETIRVTRFEQTIDTLSEAFNRPIAEFN